MGYQEPEKTRKIKLIKAINQILETRARQLSPDDFDILYDLPVEDLVYARIEIEKQYSSTASLEPL